MKTPKYPHFTQTKGTTIRSPPKLPKRIHPAKRAGNPRATLENPNRRLHRRAPALPEAKFQILPLPRGRPRRQGLRRAAPRPRRLHQHGPGPHLRVRPDRLLPGDFRSAAQAQREGKFQI